MFVLRPKQLAHYLVPASLLYLALPNAIFCIGWLEWYWALLDIGLMAVAIFESTRLAFRQEALAEDTQEDAHRITLLYTLFLLLTAIIWFGFSGVGGISFQGGDWIKHESILKDLIENSWPVIYDHFAYPLPLVYYFAYFLPAAVVGKIAGWDAAKLTLFIWTFLGLVLAVFWFWLLVRKLSYWMLLLFVFFSGIDIVGKVIAQAAGWPGRDWTRIERYSFELEYSANTVLFYWVPNQALGGWIAAGLTIYAILYIRRRSITWFPFSLSALWSPFVTIGLAPYLLAEILSDETPWRTRFRRYLSWSNLGGLALFLPIALFYLAKLYDASPYIQAAIPHSFFLSSDPGSMSREVGIFVLFLLVEVGVYALLLWKSMKSEERLWRWLFATTLIFLTLLPLYRIGHYNDLVMRASIPALFCLAVLVGRALNRNVIGLPTRIALILALVLGSATSLIEIHSNVAGTYRDVMGLPNEPKAKSIGIRENYLSLPNILLQYVGSFDSPFFHYLSKQKQWGSKEHYIAFADNRILYESYSLDKEDGLQAGEQLQLLTKLHGFYWLMDRNYSISLRLVAEGGEGEEGEKEVWKDQGWPENRPTSIWAPSATWYDTRILTIPEGTPPGIYRLDLAFADPVARDLVPGFAMPAAKYLGKVVPIGFVTVGEMQNKPEQLFAHPAQLGDKVALVGTTVDAQQSISPGQTLQVELFWQALAEMEQEYTGFVHLLSADGALVAQQDHQPRNGFLPTRIWRKGVTIPDTFSLVVPEEASPGTYTLMAGMYDLETGMRLPVSQEGTIVGDAVELARIPVQ